jgi:hypothetical protein
MLAHDVGIMYDQDAIYEAVLWAFKAAMSDAQVAPPTLAEDLALLKGHMQQIVTTSGLSVSEMLIKLGGFLDSRPKYSGYLLIRHETLSSLLNTKSRVTRMIDALEAKGLLAGKAEPGKARTVAYKLDGTDKRPRFFGINLSVLNGL